MTFDLRSGVKLYDNNWFLRHGLCEEALADRLAGLGVTYVLSQSRWLPMEDSAVQSRVDPAVAARYARLDDRRLRDLLRQRGIAYVGVLNICFDPVYAAANPQDATLDQWGRTHEMTDWYHGVAPDREANLAAKAAMLRDAVAALDPDGIHLGFVRWPGLWETWLPGDRRADKPEYGYDARTLRRFSAETGIALASDDPAAAARQIGREHRAAWTDFRVRTVATMIGDLRRAVHAVRPGTPISINTLPFFRSDFDDAVAEVFGQDVAALAPVVDVFEVMAYHQILARDAAWPEAVARDVRARSGKKAVSTVQAAPLYLQGMHAGRGRAETIDAAEFSAVLDALEESPVDGVCLFTFTQLLDRAETADGMAMLERLGRFRR
ncbi:hypothetical protein [Jiella sonneratiae]|uniref:Family 10 glycosylhydrolase n=1 Tax=Jiella sonneratiae TaxID=2816856 RepID=A0ABS3J2E2_9HYPH|nr:hypothetical protein [Jiella sonneratiae]MBO0903844.1 hypothetical protein [Jiella sonneratiae]